VENNTPVHHLQVRFINCRTGAVQIGTKCQELLNRYHAYSVEADFYCDTPLFLEEWAASYGYRVQTRLKS